MHLSVILLLGLRRTSQGIAYRRANYQRGLHDGPECKVRSVLLDGKITITNLQHVRVSTTPEVDVVHVEAVLIGYLRNTGPIH